MSKAHPLRFGFLVHDVSRLRRTVADKRLKPLGITRSQSWVLAHLHRQESGGLTQSELAKGLDVGKVTLGGLIDRLEDSGYVERRADPEDRRAKRIFMTPMGRKVVKKMQVIAEQVNLDILEGIADKDVVLLEEVLAKVKNRLISMDAVPGILPAGKVVGDD